MKELEDVEKYIEEGPQYDRSTHEIKKLKKALYVAITALKDVTEIQAVPDVNIHIYIEGVLNEITDALKGE